MKTKFILGDYVWFGDEICKVDNVWSMKEYSLRALQTEGTSVPFMAYEDEIRIATEDEIQAYLGNEEDDLN